MPLVATLLAYLTSFLHQSAILFNKFLSKRRELHDLYFAYKTDSRFDTLCDCGRGTITTVCHDCDKYPATCQECFIEYHHFNPLHWARVWDSQRGFLTCCDISVLKERTHTINMGHCEGQCHGFGPPPSPFPYHRSNEDTTKSRSSSHSTPCIQSGEIMFTIVDCNGIHATRVRFCYCTGDLDRVKQLMMLGLFPAMVNHPETAFTFRVLKQFQIVRLQGKISSYDFIDSLMCLTDGAFLFDVTVHLP